MTCGEKIISQRKKLGMSQDQLAEVLGISRQAISRWEGGSVLPEAKYLIGLSEVFKVSVDYLLLDNYSDELKRECNEMQEKKKTRNTSIIGILFCVLGICGMVILYFLSTQIPSVEMHSIGNIDVSELGTDRIISTEEMYVPVKTYSFMSFLEYYRLYFVLGILVVLFILGITIFIFSKKKRKC